MRVAIYARVSTTEQQIENQTEVLTGWVGQRGWELVKTYEEQASAWKSGQQVELANLIKDARQHKFDAVVVWALDRLTREGVAAILNLVNTLQVYRVKVISHQESWTEMPGPFAELFYALTGWVAKMESERRSERVKAGMAIAKFRGTKSGKPIGRKKYPMPFTNICKALETTLGNDGRPNYSAAARFLAETNGKQFTPGFVYLRVSREAKSRGISREALLAEILKNELYETTPKL